MTHGRHTIRRGIARTSRGATVIVPLAALSTAVIVGLANLGPEAALPDRETLIGEATSVPAEAETTVSEPDDDHEYEALLEPDLTADPGEPAPATSPSYRPLAPPALPSALPSEEPTDAPPSAPPPTPTAGLPTSSPTPAPGPSAPGRPPPASEKPSPTPPPPMTREQAMAQCLADGISVLDILGLARCVTDYLLG